MAPRSGRVDLDAGTIHYEEHGDPEGRPVVLVHGYLMASTLWHPLAGLLAERGLRAITPTWPLGGHREPMRPEADLTLPGLAATVDDLLAALGLEDVVLVGNDTGGLVSQLVAVHHRARLGALVLTSCDAFENFPPPVLRPLLLAARSPVPGTFRTALRANRLERVRRSAFGPLSHGDIDSLVQEWVRPALDDAAVADDLRRLTRSLSQETSLAVGARLGEVDLPALVAWSADDAFFPLEDGHRLAEALPRGRFELVERARTFSMLDQPARLAELVGEVSSGS